MKISNVYLSITMLSRVRVWIRFPQLIETAGALNRKSVVNFCFIHSNENFGNSLVLTFYGSPKKKVNQCWRIVFCLLFQLQFELAFVYTFGAVGSLQTWFKFVFFIQHGFIGKFNCWVRGFSFRCDWVLLSEWKVY